MNEMQQAYEAMPPEDKERFWISLRSAMLWRGWDDSGKHKSLLTCHGCDFINKVDALCLKNGFCFAEYT